MKKFLLLCFSFVFALSAWAQERTISGKVTSAEDASALPGVNVVLKGTTNGTVTDSNGNFKMSVPSNGGTLVVSFIGLATQEIAVGERSVIDISMASDITQLSEIVVTAGGLESRSRELGSASSVVNNQTLTGGRAINLAGGLQGKVAGLQINATSSGVNPEYRLVLRGQRSLTGDNQALIVVDNVIVPSSVLSTLNNNDIESVNILNGAGAAALYGSLASNGALIITTKKGKNGVTEINVSQTTQISQVAFFPKIQTKFGAGGSAYGTNQAGYGNFNYLENQSYGAPFDGTMRPLGPPLESLCNCDPNDPLRHDQDSTTYSFKKGHNQFWQLGMQNQTDFSLSTGDDKSSFFVSGQYVTVSGTTPGDKFTRGNIRINGTRKITDKLKVTYATSLAPNKSDITSATGQIYDNMLNMPSNVDITRYKNWKTDKFSTPNGFYNPWYLNPYFTADNFRQEDRNTNLTANLELKFTPIEGLDLIARQGISNRNFYQKAYSRGYTYSDWAKNTDQSSKTDIPASVAETSNAATQLVSDFIAQYNHSFGEINLNVVGGAQMKENNTKLFSTGINGLVVKDLFNLSNGTGNPSYAEADYKTHLFGAYGKVTVGYKDYLFVTATGRNDWDSRLNANNRSFFYPSGEASLLLSEAVPAIKDNGFINLLKVRGGLSKTGLVNLGGDSGFPGGFSNLGAYQTLPTFSSNVSYGTANGFPYGSLAGYSLGNTLVSKSLKPELTNSFEFGFDANLWADKITTNVTYFHSKTDNQTVTSFVSNTTGFNRLLTNAGQTENKGIEATLHVTPIQNGNWTVTVGGNYRYLVTKVNSISDLLPQLSLATSGNAVSAAVAGQPFPVIMGLDYQRDPEGHVIVDRVTGLPSATSSNVILGNATPKNILGSDAVVSYKNIRFSVLFEYRGGYSVFNGMGPNMDWSGTGYRTALYDRKSFVFPNSVIKQSDGTYVKNETVTIANGNGNNGFWSDGINRNTTSNYVTSGNFLKLREVSLSYDVPKAFLAKIGVIKGLTISAQGRNLFLWMVKNNYYTDPEYSSGGANSNGVGLNDIGQTPPVRYFGGTLSIKL